MQKPNLDRQFFLPLLQGEICPFFPEADMIDMRTITDAMDHANNNDAFPLLAVIEFNPVEGWSRDVSEDAARWVVDQIRNHEATPTPREVDFVELHLGVGCIDHD